MHLLTAKESLIIDINHTLGQIAVTHPGATDVFLRHRLDFCCGGNQKFSEACNAAGLDPSAIVAEIRAQKQVPARLQWTKKPLGELINYIVVRYHDTLRRDLPTLVETANKVERVHAKKETCPRGLAEHLERFALQTEDHLNKEERVLFPAIRAGSRGAKVHMPIRVLMQEHDDHGENLARLRQLATGYVAPPEACATWRALYRSLEKLESELMEHIHLENNLLFPRALQDESSSTPTALRD